MGAHLSLDQRDRAMLVLALEGGHSERAHERLAGEGIQISARQLRYYRNDPRYLEIREQKAPEIERAMVEDYKEAARLSNQLHRAATLKALKAVENGDIKPSELGRTAQQAAIASGIPTDKALLLEGRPTQIHGSQDLEHLQQMMARALGKQQVPNLAESEATDSTAVPLIPESADANARD